MIADPRTSDDRDTGAVLLLVMVVAIVLSLVVLALANFVAADLRYSQIVDGQAKRLTSAESAIDYAVDRLRLNQTLCATAVADGAEVSLTGSTSGGTELPAPLNATTTSVTCQRFDGASGKIADVAGWAVVITNYGEAAPADQVEVDMNEHAHLYGPVFLPDPTRTATDNDSRFELVDGDLWYTASNCDSPYSNAALAADHIDIDTTATRGAICTGQHSGDVFPSTPPIEDPLPTNLIPDLAPANGLADGDNASFPGCRVFSPGRYDLAPDLTNLAGVTGVYFRSGDYHFDFDTEWQIPSVRVWAGYPDPGSVGTLGACNTAAAADVAAGLYNGRPGATFYVDRRSRIWIGSGGFLEIFPRQQGNYIVSLHTLDPPLGGAWNLSDTTYRSVLRTLSASAGVKVHGLVWAPRGRVNIDNFASVPQHLLGGVVVQKLYLLNLNWTTAGIWPATSTVDTRVLLRATSTADGGSTTVEAMVEYRPQAPDPADRVAVSSLRVVDG